MSEPGQNLLDAAARDEGSPAIRMDDAVLTVGEEVAAAPALTPGATAVEVPEPVGRR